jgi:hypothetical protein
MINMDKLIFSLRLAGVVLLALFLLSKFVLENASQIPQYLAGGSFACFVILFVLYLSKYLKLL